VVTHRTQRTARDDALEDQLVKLVEHRHALFRNEPSEAALEERFKREREEQLERERMERVKAWIAWHEERARGFEQCAEEHWAKAA
jgi:hypothetical protein